MDPELTGTLRVYAHSRAAAAAGIPPALERRCVARDLGRLNSGRGSSSSGSPTSTSASSTRAAVAVAVLAVRRPLQPVDALLSRATCGLHAYSPAIATSSQ